jgi:predicted HicB family RNase H-like nuclease
LVTYEADSIAGLKQAFKESVDDYIETCAEIGKDPDKPMSGSLNVRIGQELHKKVHLKSKELDVSLNEVFKIALENYFEPAPKQQIHFHITSKPTSHKFDYIGSREHLDSLVTKTFKKPSVMH